MEQTGKEPIQAQSQSTRRLKRNRASAYATPSVDEKGREILVCIFCQSVIRVDDGEIASSEKETSEGHLTVLEEGKEEMPSRIVKRRTPGINDPSQFTIKNLLCKWLYTQMKRS